ncbi:hypothetical protein PHYSODRAFT_321538 [Phytophthora sojae]|uniref:Uncharacterized protein n=1 Tax=Phytophthora sojae (strain P6497) TaxID=1094619 RepID=G4YK47_PHYSP|nr:hypothetical protein PHYSODRAFT_321538 [Phytophthora sojae]EGZ27809.1 hypothetical protein PHYSODRAFT_321538 [Phytophthora sojae]|eukprot:XP_009515084.1 hypothetical protein PHYSODRAFT_321538 [Phytophthora sojae]
MIARILAKTVALRQAVQVELQGKYSTQRVQALFKYHDYVSTLCVLLVLLVTPLPCFLLILIVDAVPLRPISEGIESSQLFFVRAFVSFWIASITAFGQIKHMFPLVPLSNVKIIYLGGIVAGATVSAMYALTLVIGYPLPFGIVAVSPVWVFLLLAPLFSWMKRAHADPVVRAMLFDQNSPSVTTTCALMAAKVLQMSLSFYDIELVVRRMKALKMESRDGKAFGDDDRAGHTKENVSDTTSTSVKYRYVVELRKVLYITEFVMLVNYVEVVIPVIFSAYLLAMYHLPNGTYYDQMAEMDDIRLREAVFNVLLYAALQLEY